MTNALGRFIRSRAKELGLSLAEVARRAHKSRQTLYALGVAGGRLPDLETLVEFALVLGVHPLRLIHLVFEDYHLPVKHEHQHTERGDKSIFLADVTVPDGSVVLAGATFTKIWEIQNVGTVAWENRFLRCMDDEISVTNLSGGTLRIAEALQPVVHHIDVPFTEPGGIVRVSVDFKAPTVPGTCVSYWKSFHADGRACFPGSVGLSCKVRVLAMASTDTPATAIA